MKTIKVSYGYPILNVKTIHSYLVTFFERGPSIFCNRKQVIYDSIFLCITSVPFGTYFNEISEYRILSLFGTSKNLIFIQEKILKKWLIVK